MAIPAPRRIDLALTDDPLTCENRLSILSALHACCPETIVVLLPAHASQEDQVLRALLRGARAYLTHETLHQQLCKALNGVTEGEAWVPRKMLGRILDKLVV